MIPVELITEEELEKRLETLPDKLKDALTSDRNVNIVGQVCAKNRIAGEEKILMINQIVGLVLLGYVHDYDVATEINEALDLKNPQFSKAVADELSAKIFDPIKADLDANYQPIAAPVGSMPTSVAPAPVPLPPSAPVAPVTPPASSIVSSIIPNKQAAVPPPAPLSTPTPPVFAKGWSTIPPGDLPVPSKTVSPAAPPPSPATPPAPKAAPLGEFARLGMKQEPQKPSSPAAPAPIMLHEDVDLKPLQKSSDFRLARPAEEVSMSTSSVKQPAPLKPAVLELGKTDSAPSQKTAAPGPSMPKLVHYTDFKTETLGTPPPNVPGRKITEIVPPPSAPAAAKPVPAPASPMEPVAAAPMSQKPIAPPPPPAPSSPIPSGVSGMPPIPKPAAPMPPPPPPPAPKAVQPPGAPPAQAPGKVIAKDYL